MGFCSRLGESPNTWKHFGPEDDPGSELSQSGSSIDMYNNDVGKESAQKFMKQTGDLKAATLYFAS
jgi:hypothetical protein